MIKLRRIRMPPPRKRRVRAPGWPYRDITAGTRGVFGRLGRLEADFRCGARPRHGNRADRRAEALDRGSYRRWITLSRPSWLPWPATTCCTGLPRRDIVGASTRTRAAIGEDAFGSDLLATAGLDDRKSSGGYLSRAEELMAGAVGAEQAFFSTCGSSLSVKAGWHVRRSRVGRRYLPRTRQAADRG